MPTVIFSVIPDVVEGAPGDIVLRTFANRSEVTELISLIPDTEIILAPAFSNVSIFGANTRLTSGDEFDIELNMAFTNTSIFGEDTELTEAPPDAVILLSSAFINDFMSPELRISEDSADIRVDEDGVTERSYEYFSSAIELTIAPGDEIIRLTAALADPDSFGAATFIAVDTGGEGEDYDAVAEFNPSGTVPG